MRTTGNCFRSAIAARASDAWLKMRHLAVGILNFLQSSLAYFFEDSIIAAPFRGPKILREARSNSSTIPFARGVSGPTTVRSIPARLTKSINSKVSRGEMETQVASFSMPPFPGAQ